jgi:hypothetical protein
MSAGNESCGVYDGLGLRVSSIRVPAKPSSWCGSRHDNEIVSVFASKGQLHRLTLAYNVLLHAACAARSMERSLEHLSETTVAAFAVFAVG